MIRLTGVKEFSLQANKTAVSGFYKWLIRLGKLAWNPVEMLAPIKIPEKIPKPIAVKETEKILENAGAIDWKYKERNLAMMEVFYASGIRNAELRALDVSDLRMDEPEPYFIVRLGKGKRDGIGMLNDTAVAAIKAWLPIRAKIVRKWELPATWDALFVSRTGKRMDGWSVWNIVGQAGERVIGKRIHPHQFRHSFCTDLLNRGADLESIRKLARHKQLTTTQKYLEVSTEHLKDAYAKHPRSKKRDTP